MAKLYLVALLVKSDSDEINEVVMHQEFNERLVAEMTLDCSDYEVTKVLCTHAIGTE